MHHLLTHCNGLDGHDMNAQFLAFACRKHPMSHTVVLGGYVAYRAIKRIAQQVVHGYATVTRGLWTSHQIALE
jgi:hypothetical protein